MLSRFISRPHLQCGVRHTELKVTREVCVDHVLRVVVGESVVIDDLPVEVGAGLWDSVSLRSHEVDVEQTSAHAVTIIPLESIQQTPGGVSQHLHTICRNGYTNTHNPQTSLQRPQTHNVYNLQTVEELFDESLEQVNGHGVLHSHTLIREPPTIRQQNVWISVLLLYPQQNFPQVQSHHLSIASQTSHHPQSLGIKSQREEICTSSDPHLLLRTELWQNTAVGGFQGCRIISPSVDGLREPAHHRLHGFLTELQIG